MTVSRRTLVKAGVFVLAASSLPVSAATSGISEETSQAGKESDWLGQLRKPDFDPLVGDRFDLTGHDATASVELVKVRYPVRSGHRLAKWTEDDGTFSAIFSSKQPLTQDVYLVEHRAIGPVHLLLVPIGENDGVFLMEAAFNRAAAP